MRSMELECERPWQMGLQCGMACELADRGRLGEFWLVSPLACCHVCMKHPSPNVAYGPTINRIADVLIHMDRYAFHGVSRLAADARLDSSTVSRLLNSKRNPCFVTVARIASAIERHLDRRIDPRDLVAESGTFLTQHVCDLVGCAGCLPDNAWDEFGDLKPTFASVEPGKWISSRYPHGVRAEEGGR